MGHSEKHIAPLILGGLIASSAANLTDNVFGMVNQNHQNKINLRMMREQNAFSAEQAQIQRDRQQQMWGMNNTYNSPNAMISRGLNPFVQGSAAMAGSRSPASGGAAATAAPVPSMQAYKPNFSSVFQSLASLAQAKASEASTGEVSARVPEFNRMSLKPGIGAEWIKRYNKNVYPRDVVIVRGHEAKPPRYYDKFLQSFDADKLEDVKFSRYNRAMLNVEDSFPERLAVREEVTKARISSLSRKL